MELYRIMLVDDEEEVRTSIIRKIDWASAGFEVAGDAENGEDALEKLETLEPDVVMTDIRMPYMDGLTLAERIHQSRPSTKIIIFSGFDDFEYAKEAIRLGVTEYILKPVNVEEMTEILKKVKENLDKEIESRRDIEMLRESYAANLPILKELFLNNIIRGRVEEAEPRLSKYGIDIYPAHSWLTAAVDIDFSSSDAVGELGREKELIPVSVRNLIENKLEGRCRHTVFTAISDARPVIIIAFDSKEEQLSVTDMLRDICRESKRILGVDITIGIGMEVSAFKDIEASYKASLDALGYKKIAGGGDVIYLSDTEPMNTGVLRFGGTEESNLISAIKFGPDERITEAAERIMSRLNEARVHSRQQQAYMLGVINSIVQLMQQYEMSLASICDKAADYIEIVERIKDPESFKEWLISICLRMNRNMQEKRESSTKHIITEARLYIEENYRNPELSVDGICSHLHMSPAYFSTLFKKEMNQTYIAYLTDLRLNKAVELLNTTDDKTYIIAEKVGYQEQNYFSYVFKKKFGVSPTRYRGSR